MSALNRICSLKIEFEGRETQTAESWRIYGRKVVGRTDSGELCVSYTITVMFTLGNRGGHYSVKVPVTQKIPWINFQAKIQNQYFQLESLILAQNERWRQA